MKKLLVCIGLLGYIAGFAQAQFKLSPSSEISVMTLGPFQGELYSAFGHSAIHVYDPESRLDLAYHYGVFDFDQENFIWNFARGHMIYMIGRSDYKRFKRHYVKENRYIIEQKLNLTLEERQQFMDFLSENYKPENREYLYNYVYDNCATKIPEVLKKIFPNRLEYYQGYTEEGKTIRDLMDDYLMYQPWGDWIIDIGLGMQIDKEASPEEYMFLPDYVALTFSKATIDRDTVKVPLVSETVNVFTPEPETHENGFFTPFNFFVILFFVVGFFTNRDFKKERRTKWIDPILFTLPGIMGWWLVFLWVGTEHLSKENLNVLWAIPFHIPFAYLINVAKLRKFLSSYFLIVSAWYSVMLIIWSALPQPLHNALIPLILTLILRGFYIHFDLKKQMRKAARKK